MSHTPRVITILGMHRSGTSVAGALLESLGGIQSFIIGALIVTDVVARLLNVRAGISDRFALLGLVSVFTLQHGVFGKRLGNLLLELHRG